MVDFFILLLTSGAGDELQGIKKGVVELVDAVLINKSDGDNIKLAQIARNEYSNALHFLNYNDNNWKTGAYTCSARTGAGIDDLWNLILKFEKTMKANNFFDLRRKEQNIKWFYSLIDESIKNSFYNDNKKLLKKLEKEILNSNTTVISALSKIFNKN